MSRPDTLIVSDQCDVLQLHAVKTYTFVIAILPLYV